MATLIPIVALLATPLLSTGLLTNLFWSSVFGSTLCLSAFIQGDLGQGAWTIAGAWLVLIWPLIFLTASGKLWDVLSNRGRSVAMLALTVSIFAVVPVDLVWRLDETGIHFPEILYHLMSVR